MRVGGLTWEHSNACAILDNRGRRPHRQMVFACQSAVGATRKRARHSRRTEALVVRDPVNFPRYIGHFQEPPSTRLVDRQQHLERFKTTVRGVC